MWKTFRILWKMMDSPERWDWEHESADRWEYFYYPEGLDMRAYASREKALAFVLFEHIFGGSFDVAIHNVLIYPWWMRKLLGRKARKMRENYKKHMNKTLVKSTRTNEYSRIMNAVLGVKQNDP